VDFVGIEADKVDGGLTEFDAALQLPAPGPDKFLGVRVAKRHEQQTRLVYVAVILIDNRDREVLRRILPAEAIRSQGAASPATQDHNSLSHLLNTTPMDRPASRSEGP
jgi:hypothetical protein